MAAAKKSSGSKPKFGSPEWNAKYKIKGFGKGKTSTKKTAAKGGRKSAKKK